MSSTFADRDLSVDEVVDALVGPSHGGAGAQDLHSQTLRAAKEIDGRTAQSFGEVLVQSLCDDSSNPRRLEALVVLGLAHPEILGTHRVDLVQEGKRLAALLERRGEVDRSRKLLEILAELNPQDRSIVRELASVMRRNGDVDELIERYLANADEGVKRGRPEEAISWLQEVLLLDRTRRDVARMIRDLRYSVEDRKARARARYRIALGVLLLSAIVSAVVLREYTIGRRYQALPQAGDGEAALVARLAGIDELVDEHRFWFGMFRPMTEREGLRERLVTIEERKARERREVEQVSRQRDTLADASRDRGVILARRGDFAEALRDLNHALELSSESWPHRQRVLADIRAIEETMERATSEEGN